MAWRDNLLDGSFRGAPFKIVEHEHRGGRRIDSHEYPFRDLNYAEDLGLKAREYRVSCLVIGPDYMADRDALKDACEASGPGTLVHPYLGSKQVSCRDFSIRESTDEGGAAYFEIDFLEAGQNTVPAVSEDTQATANDAADAAATQTALSLDKALVVDGLPEFVGQSAIDQLGAAIEAVRDSTAMVADLGGVLKAQFQDEAADLLGGLGSLVGQPLELAARVQSLMGELQVLASTPEEAFAALSSLLVFGSDPPAATGTTPSRIQEAANIDAVVRLVRRSAACEMVRAVSRMSFASYQEAVRRRDDFADQLDQILDDAGDVDDDAFVALRDLRLKMVRDVTARGGSLVRLFTYSPPEAAPALLIAHRLYGDALRDGDIVSRNPVVHPGFVAAGQGLEVPVPGSADG